jgi:hypothetical protein
MALCHAGENRDVAEQDVARFRSVGVPVADLIGWKPYPEMQTVLDVSAPKGLLYYFKCAFLTELSDEALRTIISYGESAPAPLTNIILEHVHGKASRVSPEATAFVLRRNQYSLNIVPGWQDPGTNDRCVQWARAFAVDMERFGTGDTYVNYLAEEGQAAVQATYGPNYNRLARIKLEYDPGNFFRFNQNIIPSASASCGIDSGQADAAQA